MDGSSVRGIVTIQQAARVTPDKLRAVHVVDLMRPLEPAFSVAASDSMYRAFEKASRNGLGRLVVLNGSSLVGYLSIKDIKPRLDSRQRAGLSSGPARRHAA